MGKSVKMFVSHVNPHQRVISAEEGFNNQVDRMTCSVDTSQPLSTATLVIAQWTHEPVAVVAGTEVMHGLGKMEEHSLRPA